MKNVIVPFFISHQGCPHQCVFCDQRVITGRQGAIPKAEELLSTIREWRRTSGVEPVEVAFYGGSFTLLSIELQKELLMPLNSLLKSGEVSSVRLSTRPDAVDAATAGFLRESGVSVVELGVQSMDDEVLKRSARGHTAHDTLNAFAALRVEGLKIGAQMMPGLPGDTVGGALASFREILFQQPDLVRIYPAVVLNGTELARMYHAGEYAPLTLEEAVSLCKVMLHDAELAGVPVIRVGLQPTDDLSCGGELLAGPYHPALRQLAQGERWFDLLKILASDFSAGAVLTIYVSLSEVSDVVGQKRVNILRLENHFGVVVAGVYVDESISAGRIRISDGDNFVHGDLLRDLTYS